MRKIFIIPAMLAICALASTAMAQSVFEECQQKKNDIAEMEQQAQQMDADIANLDLKIRDLERQKQQLLRDKFDKAREKAKLQKRIHIDRRMMNRMCAGLRQCGNLEQRIDALKSRIAPLAERLRRIRREIGERNADSLRLNREVNKIETNYRQLNCDNLVAGQTQQATIDRCNDLFSRWNQMQKDINGLRASAAALRGRYRRVMQKMRIHGAELNRLIAKMRRRCGHSTRLAELENLEREQTTFGNLKTELDQIDSSIRKIPRLKIVRPRIRPMLKKKPELHKVLKHKKKKHDLRKVR
jgi:chromosome segregation ATPase